MTDKRTWFYGPRQCHAVMWEVKNPKGIIQIVHGMVEYVERYDDFARTANQAGFIVVGHDHVGHGQTAKTKSDFGKFPTEWEALIEDVHDLKKTVQNNYPDLPYFILGHSMGSYILRLYLAIYDQDNLSGAIIMGTGQQPEYLTSAGIALAEAIKLFKGKDYRSKILESLSTGAYNKRFKPNRTKSDWLNRNPEEVDKYIADPYHQFLPTVNMYRAIFIFAKLSTEKKWIDAMPHSLPLLIISGANDPVGDFGKGVKRFYRILKSDGFKNITMKLFGEARHEILNEINKQEVKAYILNWIKKNM